MLQAWKCKEMHEIRIECAAKGGSRRRPDVASVYRGLQNIKIMNLTRQRPIVKRRFKCAYGHPPKGVPGGDQNWDLVGNSMTLQKNKKMLQSWKYKEIYCNAQARCRQRGSPEGAKIRIWLAIP